MELIDLKRTEADKKAEAKRWESIDERDDYPYGLSIHISEEVAEKLGLSDKDFDAGNPVKIVAEGFISEDRVTQSNGSKRRSLSIQMTKMAVDQEGESTSISGAMYGDK